jgi:hypothetical protein
VPLSAGFQLTTFAFITLGVTLFKLCQQKSTASITQGVLNNCEEETEYARFTI